MSRISVGPCPFCSSDNADIEEIVRHVFAVVCRQCEAMGPTIRLSAYRAIEAWNTRGKPPVAAVPDMPAWSARICEES